MRKIKFIKQGEGECLRACVSMVTGISYKDVPSFVGHRTATAQAKKLNKWCRENGMFVMWWEIKSNWINSFADREMGDSYYIFIYQPTDHGHAVVCRKKKIVFDPDGKSVYKNISDAPPFKEGRKKHYAVFKITKEMVE